MDFETALQLLFYPHLMSKKMHGGYFMKVRFSILLLQRSSSSVLTCNSVKHIEPTMTFKMHYQHKKMHCTAYCHINF